MLAELAFRRDAGNGARGNHVDPQCLAAVKLMIAIASGYLLLFDTAEMKISARNILRGRVKRVVEGAVNCELTLEIAPGIEIVSIITKASVESLDFSRRGVRGDQGLQRHGRH